MHRNRRRFLRANIPIPIQIFSGARWLSATATDISQDGLRILWDGEMQLNKRLGLRFGNRSDTFGVKVCWVQGGEIGCAFFDTLDEPSYNKIVRDTSAT